MYSTYYIISFKQMKKLRCKEGKSLAQEKKPRFKPKLFRSKALAHFTMEHWHSKRKTIGIWMESLDRCEKHKGKIS